MHQQRRGTGNQMCTVSGLTYSSTGIVGSTAAITTSVCGDGRLEAISTGSNRCPLVGSQAAQQGGVTAEQCDVNSNAKFGQFNGACGAASGCVLDNTLIPAGVDVTDAATDVLAQRIWGLTTSDMQNLDYNPHSTAVQSVPQINPCIYSSAMDTTDFATASKCTISASDITKYTTLANCYNSDVDSPHFGHRLNGTNGDATQNQNFALNHHKCNELLGIRIMAAAGGKQSWEPTQATADEFT